MQLHAVVFKFCGLLMLVCTKVLNKINQFLVSSDMTGQMSYEYYTCLLVLNRYGLVVKIKKLRERV